MLIYIAKAFSMTLEGATLRIYNNMMINFQRRIGEFQLDAITKNQSDKAQEYSQAPKNGKIDDSIKSPTERLLSTYFDVEV